MSYNKVKKLKGETFAKTLRDAEGGILDIPEIAEIVRHSSDDASAIVTYLQAYVLSQLEEVEEVKPRNIEDVLADAGYDYFPVKNLKEQEPLRKYYREEELVCSFGESAWGWKGIFFVIKKDAESIKPAANPKREDDYSTSVLRIKVSDNAVSIVSRYNHTVSNPDATFKNNLERVAEGLTAAVAQKYNVVLSGSGIRDLLPEFYYVSADGRIIYADVEQSGVNIGKNAWLEAGAIHTPKPQEIIIEGCILSADCTKLRPICNGSDVQGISKAWNDNSQAMIKLGYKFTRIGMEIYATKKSDKILIAELC